VQQRVLNYFTAMRTGDSATIAGFLAQDYRLIGMSGTLWTRSERLKELSAKGPAFESIEPSELDVCLFDSVAVVTGLVTIHDQGEVIRERFTQVWLEQSNVWQMRLGQITAVARPAAPR